MQVVITKVPITYAHVRAEVVSASFTNRTVTTWDPTRFYCYSISYKTYYIGTLRSNNSTVSNDTTHCQNFITVQHQRLELS